MKINNHFEDRFLMSLPNLEDLWVESNFKPNEDQQEAIRHINSPLYLTAGPGSGKTRDSIMADIELNSLSQH
jgi:hypothetical protein